MCSSSSMSLTSSWDSSLWTHHLSSSMGYKDTNHSKYKEYYSYKRRVEKSGLKPGSKTAILAFCSKLGRKKFCIVI